MNKIERTALGPMTGLEWLNSFEAFARRLADESQKRTSNPLPGNQGFSVKAGEYRK